MKNEPRAKNSKKTIPVISFVLFLGIGPFNSGAGGFFLLVSVVSFLLARMTDNPPTPGSSMGYNLSDWDLPSESGSMEFDLFMSTGSGASAASAGITAEMDVTATESIGKSYTDM